MSSASNGSIPRFIAIDGLRAWMAWLVVLSHVFQQAFPWSEPLVRLDLGGHAVDVFIIISGFVITHLLLERSGGYLAYIVPRFMRLFPAFAVCCVLGAACYGIAHAWADPQWFGAVHGDDWRSLARYWPQHALTHVVMLHGAIPNIWLPESQYAFDPPGWSVSLEWQFYLLAPFAIRLCKTATGAFALIMLVAISSIAYHFVFHALWERPSILIGTGKFFLIGIACRYATPYLAGSVKRVAAIGTGLLFTLFWIGSPSIAVWLLVFSFVLRDARPERGIDARYVSIVRTALESRTAQHLAERSYSTYLLHWPLLTVIGAVATNRGILPGSELATVMLLIVPLTLVLQEPIYRLVELPTRKLGKRWARNLGAGQMREVARETVETGLGR